MRSLYDVYVDFSTFLLIKSYLIVISRAGFIFVKKINKSFNELLLYGLRIDSFVNQDELKIFLKSDIELKLDQ